VHPGEESRAVLRDTPMTVHVAAGGPRETPPPSARELELIRTELDPDGWYTQ